MRKSDKKIDNELRRVLTDVCQQALKMIDGFEWLTHQADFHQFPDSLQIICVFDNEQQRQAFLNSAEQDMFEALLIAKLKQIDIKLIKLNKYVVYDSEEACLLSHQGNWAKRLRR